MNLPEVIPKRAATHHRYRHWSAPITECWTCQRRYAQCITKRTYDTRAEAEAVAAEINRRENYVNPVTQYPCDFGSKEQPHWHLAHCRTSTELKRQRRLWRRWQASLAAPPVPSPEVPEGGER